jgi:hypothetical protein
LVALSVISPEFVQVPLIGKEDGGVKKESIEMSISSSSSSSPSLLPLPILPCLCFSLEILTQLFKTLISSLDTRMYTLVRVSLLLTKQLIYLYGSLFRLVDMYDHANDVLERERKRRRKRERRVDNRSCDEMIVEKEERFLSGNFITQRTLLLALIEKSGISVMEIQIRSKVKKIMESSWRTDATIKDVCDGVIEAFTSLNAQRWKKT